MRTISSTSVIVHSVSDRIEKLEKMNAKMAAAPEHVQKVFNRNAMKEEKAKVLTTPGIPKPSPIQVLTRPNVA